MAPGEEWGTFHEQVNDLMHKEKKARQDNQHDECAEFCVQIVAMAWERKMFAKVRELAVTMMKRRGQGKKAQVDIVQTVLNKYMPELPSREEKFHFLETMREISNGKIFLETEYAAMTKQLCQMFEEDGKIDEACKIIQEVQIETYGSLQAKDKIDFILYQMKLVLQRGDYIRLLFISKKVSKRSLDAEGLETSKILYYKFMVRYHVQEKEYLNAAKAYQTIYDTLAKAKSDEKLIAALDQSGQERKTSF